MIFFFKIGVCEIALSFKHNNGPFHLKTLICSKRPSKHYVSTFSEKNTPTQSEHPEGKSDPILDPEGPTWLKIHGHFGLVSRFR